MSFRKTITSSNRNLLSACTLYQGKNWCFNSSYCIPSIQSRFTNSKSFYLFIDKFERLLGRESVQSICNSKIYTFYTFHHNHNLLSFIPLPIFHRIFGFHCSCACDIEIGRYYFHYSWNPSLVSIHHCKYLAVLAPRRLSEDLSRHNYHPVESLNSLYYTPFLQTQSQSLKKEAYFHKKLFSFLAQECRQATFANSTIQGKHLLSNISLRSFRTSIFNMKLPEESIHENPSKYFKNYNPQRHKIVPQQHLFLANLTDDKLSHVREIASQLWKENKMNLEEENRQQEHHSDEENYFKSKDQSNAPPITAVYYKPEKRLAYVSFENVSITSQIFEYLTQQRKDIHVQYAKLRTETDFLIGLVNISSSGNEKRVESIPGLIYIEDYLTEEEEQFIVDELHKVPRHNEVFSEKNGRDIKRSIWHFGYEFKYSNNTAGRVADPLPDSIQFLVDRVIKMGKEYGFITKDRHYLHAKNGLLDSPHDDLQLRTDEYFDLPNQCTVNEYQVGEGIAPHIDNAIEFGTWVVSISLMSDTVMCFKSINTGKITDVILPRRSLIILTGPSRYNFLHSIRHRRYDAIDGELRRRDVRMSITFRHAYTMGSSCNLVNKNLHLEEYKEKLFSKNHNSIQLEV